MGASNLHTGQEDVIEAQEQPRDQWGTKLGFILAAVGSAIGLGNIWRYPYIAYENGGGAFLLPYFIAIVTAGIPVLILEYTLGNRSGHAAPFAFRSISRRWEWLGWWQIAVAFFIVTYYIVIIGWVLSYIWFSFGTQWGDDTGAFFDEYLGTSESFWQVGGIQFNVLLAVVIAWAVVYAILLRGVRRGIETASKILIPTLIVMLVIITIRGLTLPGAVEGLNVLLTPDFSQLTNGSVWVAAYGQVFFSLSVGFSIMIAYSSYLSRRTDLTNSAFIVGLSNCGFEFLAALGVFSVLGFLSVQQGVPVTEVVESGIGLAFVTFPEIINQLPALNSFFGLMFFGALFFAGITSAVSILECSIAGVREKFNLSRGTAVTWVCGLAALVSLLYVTRGGLFYLDVVDRFVNNYGIVTAALVEVIFIAWVARRLGVFQDYANERSYFRAGRWWIVFLSIITPALLGIVTLYNLYFEVTTPYADYPWSGLLVFGFGVAILCVVVGFILQNVRSRDPESTGTGQPEESEAR